MLFGLAKKQKGTLKASANTVLLIALQNCAVLTAYQVGHTDTNDVALLQRAQELRLYHQGCPSVAGTVGTESSTSLHILLISVRMCTHVYNYKYCVCVQGCAC